MPRTTVSPSLRQGFTLVELLVVIAIILAIMGIGFGAVMAAQRDTPLGAAAVLTADFLRQARATSIALASPVEIRIEEVDGRVSISGVTNRPVFDLHFNRDPESGGLRKTDEKHPLPGVAGYCWEFGPGGPDDIGDGPIGPFPLDRRRSRLMANDGDGFHLEFWLRPTVLPALRPGQVDDDLELPVIHIGNSDDWRDAWFSFFLKANTITVQEEPQALTQGNAGHVRVRHWMPMVYLGDDHSIRGERRSGALHPTSDNEKDVVAPVIGGRWVHYALTYDGERLFLRQDGLCLTWEIELDSDNNEIVSDGSNIGIIAAPARDQDLTLYLAGKEGLESAGSRIDLLRLIALGTDRPAQLPGIVALDPPGLYRIVFNGPQIRFEGPGDDRVIRFILRTQEMMAADQRSSATVSLETTGRVGVTVESRN